MFFFYQQRDKESAWEIAMAKDRAKLIQERQPAFTTVLDLDKVPDDNDWSKARYLGPLYFDFDADGDLELACAQVRAFVGKLVTEVDFDVEQARFYASGSKGFHVEIPMECFVPEVRKLGYQWLPYVYREIAQKLIVDTLDLSVYTGKRGRQWRTEGVKRENGCYKVPLSASEILEIDPDAYADVIRAPRTVDPPTPPSINPRLAMMFDQAREKVANHMRGRKKRLEVANAVLDPWRKAKRTMPSVERIMRGEVSTGAGFQHIAMQLAIYGASVDMSPQEFVQKCEGLIQNHVSDSNRYNTPKKRAEELQRMLQYMAENTLYDFETGPLLSLQPPGADTSDLGVAPDEDAQEEAGRAKNAPAALQDEDAVPDPEAPVGAIGLDLMAGVRGNVYQSSLGLMSKRAGVSVPLCRAKLKDVDAIHDADNGEFKGFEVNVVLPTGRKARAVMSPDLFVGSATMRKFFAHHGESYHGTDSESIGLLDMLNAKASGRRIYSFPREGFMVLPHPEDSRAPKLLVYLTQDTFLCSDEIDFQLKYRPVMATSSYKVDIEQGPELCDEHIPYIHDLLNINRPDIVADLVGWFVAAFYRSCYLDQLKQFPLLQIYGDAGSGKSQTVKLLSHLHWFSADNISLKSATSMTPFAMDTHFSTSTSAPLLIDEFKPREIQIARKGAYEKLKEGFKMSYVGGDIGERGTLNKGAENGLSVIKSRATAPVVFIGEAIESETAILERCVTVAMSQSFKTRDRTEAFLRLQGNPEALSAIGRDLLQRGLAIDLAELRRQVAAIRDNITSTLPLNDEGVTGVPDRLIYNRAIVVHGLRVLKDLLADRFGTEFDNEIEKLINAKGETGGSASADLAVHSISEISKVLNRMSLLSRVTDKPYAIMPGKDYMKGNDYLELKVERAFDAYCTWCAAINDRRLFDTMESFLAALSVYGPVTDRVCAGSDLRDDDSNERVFRFNLAKLRTAGVGNFRG